MNIQHDNITLRFIITSIIKSRLEEIEIMNWSIESVINEYVKNYKEQKGTETQWREPIIGVAGADNPMFLELKEVIGTTHAIPYDFIDDAKSVIVFFLPFSREIVKSNIGNIQSSREWDIANIETNNLILDINKYVHDRIGEMGYTSTVLPATYNYDEKSLSSDWSHRHVAYIAGIGTFGINNMLITQKGCCGRIGSIITNMPLKATERKDGENCLYKHKGICKRCVDNCVAGAISVDDGYPFVDRNKCNEQVYDGKVPVYDIGIGDACGKCMCNMPCSFINPVRK